MSVKDSYEGEVSKWLAMKSTVPSEVRGDVMVLATYVSFVLEKMLEAETLTPKGVVDLLGYAIAKDIDWDWMDKILEPSP